MPDHATGSLSGIAAAQKFRLVAVLVGEAQVTEHAISPTQPHVLGCESRDRPRAQDEYLVDWILVPRDLTKQEDSQEQSPAPDHCQKMGVRGSGSSGPVNNSKIARSVTINAAKTVIIAVSSRRLRS
jgi:hypothetical protein